ncbi:MAG: DUF3299 domain-containing protein [Planctomycetia bacterium]
MARTDLVRRAVLGLGSLLMAALLAAGVRHAATASSTVAVAPASTSSPSQEGLPGLHSLPAGVKVDVNGILEASPESAAPGTRYLSWEVLRSFEYSAAVGLGGIPDALKAVDGQRVTMVGFLMPSFEWEDIKQFALVGSYWSCCFGMPAGLNGTVNVTLARGRPGLERSLEPLQVVGTFRAAEVREAGWLIAIYSIADAEVSPLR